LEDFIVSKKNVFPWGKSTIKISDNLIEYVSMCDITYYDRRELEMLHCRKNKMEWKAKLKL